ncbi:hypothetical protein EMIT0P218_260025 [Pseudomonas sp. IT-P218]
MKGLNVYGARRTAFASKPAPTFDLHWTQNLCSATVQCGSGLAREGVSTVKIIVRRDPR